MNVRVRVADAKLAKSPCKLKTLAVGSCVAISLYDRARKMGCLCHSLLPRPEIEHKPPCPRYATDAIEIMIERLKEEGSSLDDVEAKLMGGASLFVSLRESGDLSIGAKNVEAARASLQNIGVSIVAEDVGGIHGRSIEFSTEDGCVTVRSAHSKERML